MKTVAISALQRELGEFAQMVQNGQAIRITRRGKAIFDCLPIEKRNTPTEEQQRRFIHWLNALGPKGIAEGSIVAELRAEATEKRNALLR